MTGGVCSWKIIHYLDFKAEPKPADRFFVRQEKFPEGYTPLQEPRSDERKEKAIVFVQMKRFELVFEARCAKKRKRPL